MSDSAYCYCGRHFGVDIHASAKDRTFSPIMDIEHGTDALGVIPKLVHFCYTKTVKNIFAVERQQAYGTMSATRKKTVVDLLDSEHRKQVINITVSNCCLFYNFKVSQWRTTMAVNLGPFNKCKDVNSLKSSNTNGGAFILVVCAKSPKCSIQKLQLGLSTAIVVIDVAMIQY